MLATLHKKSEFVGAFIIGFLFSLITFLFKEISDNPIYISLGIILVFVAIYLARKTAHHFHNEHTHVMDSAFDIVAIGILFLVNILHPAVDGFSFYEIFIRQGLWAVVFFALGILIHEFVRQSVLVTAFKNMGIKWYWVVFTTLFGISLGIVAGIFSNNFLQNYEGLIDLGTLFAYSFIASELYFGGHTVNKSSQIKIFAVGAVVGIVVSILG